MLTVHIRPHWEISVKGEVPLDMANLLGLLLSIQDTGSIAQAAKSVGLSYRYAWGLLRAAESLFGTQLLQTGRGRGTLLTPLAQKLVWADRRIAARLSPTLHSLASELEAELGRITANTIRTLRMDASHGFAVAALTGCIDRDALPLDLRYRTSTDAVAALARRECDLAGFHIPLGRFEAQTTTWYLRWLDPNLHCLVRVAGRQQGLIVARDNPLGIRGLADLARPEVRFVNRQAGSGTRMLLEMMLAADGPPPESINGFNSAEFTHSAVAAYIASGMADAGFGMQAAAAQFKLDFLPLVREHYYFALRRDAVDEPAMRQLFEVMRNPAYHRLVAALPGYDAAGTGELVSIAEAFSLQT
ncbi:MULTISPECIES: substrate-binding domain-containing protein [unclassified Massilia]|uniref:helix-turn-helix transcriptional regulator n=1 Tax=unclassified Massilia TaxID=2609279 RepID=UPI00178016ED|nr:MULTISPECIES: substrate-binding domain-containing protein [unclassified Massilia]MBD8529878.1 helix-turn-helix transcriptional regulator [Massilia sp. CFBP 13647]MBD8672110.1 helix-turn-helix transcriptional regulator [Massilia sp. CFBP 13721]